MDSQTINTFGTLLFVIGVVRVAFNAVRLSNLNYRLNSRQIKVKECQQLAEPMHFAVKSGGVLFAIGLGLMFATTQ